MAGGGEALAAMASGLGEAASNVGQFVGDAASSVGQGVGSLFQSAPTTGMAPGGGFDFSGGGAANPIVYNYSGPGLLGATGGNLSFDPMQAAGGIPAQGSNTLDTMKQIMGGAKDLMGQMNQGGANRAQVQAPQAGPTGGILPHVWGAAFDPTSRIGTIAPFNRVSVNPGPPPLSGLFR